MASWDLLDERGESELHKSRLLNVEEKPFKRITKRLATISSVVSSASHTKPANGGNVGSHQLQEDLTLDFAAFDSSIARLQFLHDANVRERERYEADKQRILGECQAARETNARLREHLEGSRATLAQRKRFDELAEKIVSNKALRPREDQFAALAKLEDECRELERESETYSETWRERRDQFNRIMEEGMLLRRQIRDEKEEVDRREGMNEDEAEDEADEPSRAGGQTPGLDPSGAGTPRPDGGVHQGTPGPDALLKAPAVPASFRSASRASTREPSAPPQQDGSTAVSEDVDMDDEAAKPAPQRNGDKMEVDI